MKVFLDVNVIVDYVTSGERFGAEAAEIITLAKHGEFEAVTDPNTFVIAFFRMNRLIKDPARCKEILIEVRKIIGCVDMNAKTLGLALTREKPKDLEDGVQIEAALACKADMFLTNNKKLLKTKEFSVMTTEHFLKQTPYKS
ncbi:PIN domain-containing protein [Neolewinella aurantiaca]|uniref:PIN domain-containing protein n=1 Tax=Neolewinella aurantiaca TaxID=2602767 RepID=A0A5C7FGL4_9BACT|nr:PIN domain-containing protein [Neolewinella aurantiaca]TXF89504.1 PIN domain-containing protein [Neolewinella aurantiaca]